MRHSGGLNRRRSVQIIDRTNAAGRSEGEQNPTGGPESRNMYTSLVSDSQKRVSSSGQRRVTQGNTDPECATPSEGVVEEFCPLPFCNISEYCNSVQHLYMDGMQVIQAIRAEYHRSCPDLQAILEAAFRRYAMLRVDMEWFVSATANYDVDGISNEHLQYYPIYIYSNMYDHLDWISDILRRTHEPFTDHFGEHIEELKRVIFQMRSASAMYRRKL